MLLCAGRGERMRPLTDNCPKPLLKVGDKSLAEMNIEKLVDAGIKDLVVNHAWFGEMVEESLGDGNRYGCNITYSPEEKALETGGGIANAINYLGDAPFIVVNGDIWTDFDFRRLVNIDFDNFESDAHLVFVENPQHNPGGDFTLEDGRVRFKKTVESAYAFSGPAYTFSGIGIYRPNLFKDRAEKKFPLITIFNELISNGRCSGELWSGDWTDVGTPERLDDLKTYLSVA